MLIRPQRRRVKELEFDDGTKPFAKWFGKLRDARLKGHVRKLFIRVGEGNFGDYRYIEDGVFELRIDYGPGIRIYFALDGEDVVVILLGGDKSIQDRDIKKAKDLWRQYLEQKHGR